MYDNPQVDMGYDISNYESVYEPYDTVTDIEVLMNECYARGMFLIVDLVINITNLHERFREFRSSRKSSKRDWYMWRPAKLDTDENGRPPNDWRGNSEVVFGNGMKRHENSTYTSPYPKSLISIGNKREGILALNRS